MTIHPVYPQDVAQQTPRDADSVWSTEEVPELEPTGLERTMLQQDKLYVVLAVVLIIWFGLAFFIFRTDRRLRALERTVAQDISSHEETEGV